MARTITYQQAINEALAQEMERDPTVVVFGEDVAGGAGAPGEDDAWGGVLGVTKGLYAQVPRPRARHPDQRVRLHRRGGGRGGVRAAPGRRADVRRLPRRLPGPDLQPGRQVPLHVRRQGGHADGHPRRCTARASAPPRSTRRRCTRSSPTSRGSRSSSPSNPYDAKGLLIQSIRDDDPVIFLEHKVLYTLEGDVPEEAYAIPFGEANIVREGSDVTVVALGPDGAVRRAGRRGAPARRRHRAARSSTCARRRRSTWRRSSRASRTPGAWSWWTSRARAAGWPRTSSGSSRRRRSGTSRRPRRWSRRRTRPSRSARRSRTPTCPSPEKIAAAVREVAGAATAGAR